MKNKYLMRTICIILTFLCVISPIVSAYDPIPDEIAQTPKRQHVGVNGGNGSEELPYILNMGTPVIKIYYKQDFANRSSAGEKIKDSSIYFKFTTGSNAGNYMVEHNEDKGMLKFTLIGTTDQDLKVTSSKGINYFQAGGVCYLPMVDAGNTNNGTNENKDENKKSSGDSNRNVQMPVYKIMAKETLSASAKEVIDKITGSAGGSSTTHKENITNEKVIHETELGNGYLSISDQIAAANISNYSQSYVFAKSGVDFNKIYRITEAQERNKAKFNCSTENENGKLESKELRLVNSNTFEAPVKHSVGNDTSRSGYNETISKTYNFSGPVDIVYQYVSTNSRLNDNTTGEASLIERTISKLLVSLGDKFVKICKLGGNNGELYITIDALVFNEYKNTVIDFWGDTTGTNQVVKVVINFWYKVFKAWAIVIYILILIYIGIKVVLSSGTPEDKKSRPMLEGAIIGILLLALLPFLFKYLVVINDAIVDILRVNSKYSVYAYYTFEDSYRNDEEDGEDSMTNVLDSLKREQRVIKEKQEDVEKEKEDLEIKYGEFMEMAENAEEEKVKAQEKVNESLDSVDKIYTDNFGFEFRRGDATISASQLKSEMWRVIDDYIKSNNIKYDGENFVPDYHDSIRDVIKNYASQLKVYDPNTGEEAKHPSGKQYDGQEWYTGILQKAAKDALIEIEYYYVPIMEADYANEEIRKAEEQLAYLEQKLQDVEDAIIKATSNDADIMGELRMRAGKEYRIIYVILWFVMLFETILLLIIYYKRLFMLAMLITVFPLVTVAYVYEKAKGEKPKILNNWMLEFSANVFIQTIHAILYVTLVEVGYSIYIDNNDNVVFCLIAIVSLITSEPILKAMLGIKSSTVSDLAKYSASAGKAALAAGALASTVMSTGKDLKSIDNKSKNEEAKIAKNQARDDKRLGTLRKANENRINKNGRLTEEQKEQKLKHWENVHNTTDRIKENARDKMRAARRMKKRMDKISRVTANVTSGFGAVAGGIAAGGSAENFNTAAGVAKTLTGTGNNVKLSEDAEKNEVKVQNQVGNVSSENPSDGGAQNPSYQTPNYQGKGYDYAYENASNNAAESAAQDIGPKIKPRLAAKYASRLDEQKTFIEKQYNIRHEDEK